MLYIVALDNLLNRLLVGIAQSKAHAAALAGLLVS